LRDTFELRYLLVGKLELRFKITREALVRKKSVEHGEGDRHLICSCGV
jgi:hypothetical protein